MVLEATTGAEIDKLFSELDAKKLEWAQLPASKKLQILKVSTNVKCFW
jgi:hypothetical protein